VNVDKPYKNMLSPEMPRPLRREKGFFVRRVWSHITGQGDDATVLARNGKAFICCNPSTAQRIHLQRASTNP